MILKCACYCNEYQITHRKESERELPEAARRGKRLIYTMLSIPCSLCLLVLHVLPHTPRWNPPFLLACCISGLGDGRQRVLPILSFLYFPALKDPRGPYLCVFRVVGQVNGGHTQPNRRQTQAEGDEELARIGVGLGGHSSRARFGGDEGWRGERRLLLRLHATKGGRLGRNEADLHLYGVRSGRG